MIYRTFCIRFVYCRPLRSIDIYPVFGVYLRGRWIRGPDPAVRAGKFQDHSYRKHDGDGLFLLVNKSGRYSHFRFWLGANARGKPKERVMALGVYPNVNLSKARADRDKARALLA